MESEYELASIEAKLPDPISAEWVAVVLDRQTPNIFLNHSGAQKNFVEQLCEDLERAKQSPFFDKRPHSLPKGVEFAPLIFTATQECEVAVVVVSDDYFTRSKWPMLELAAIVQAPGCKILPLFYGLSCKEFKNPKRRERWFQVWDGWSKLDDRISVDVWQAALRNLDGLNGMEYVKANGEVSYRKEIVTTICDMMQWSSHLDEIIVVERGASDASECDLQQPAGLGTATPQFDLCGSSSCLIIFLVQVVVLLSVLLLSCALDHLIYLHHLQVRSEFRERGGPDIKLYLKAGIGADVDWSGAPHHEYDAVDPENGADFEFKSMRIDIDRFCDVQVLPTYMAIFINLVVSRYFRSAILGRTS